MGALEQKQVWRLWLVEEFRKVGDFPEKVLKEIEIGEHGPAFDAVLNVCARVHKAAEWSK
jgi:hypothetical protein